MTDHRRRAEELFVVMRGYRTLEPCLKILSDALKEVEEETFARAVGIVEKRREYYSDVGGSASEITALGEAIDALREEAAKK